MNWILLATLGQFLNAAVAMIDKYIVSDERALPRPFVYAFYSCLLTGAWVGVYFLGFIPGLSELGMPKFTSVRPPSLTVVALAFLAAYTFFFALVSMFEALRKADATNVMPVIGSVSALSAFGLSHAFLDTSLSDTFVIGIVLLAVGTLLVAQTLPKLDIVLQVTHSGLFFALHAITMKGLFLETSFDDGFFWSRVAFTLFALSLLLVPAYLNKIRTETSNATKRTGGIILLNKVLAGAAAFLLLKATDLGEVSVVQSLDGLKFVFILIIGVLFAHWLPDSMTNRDPRPQTFFRNLLYVAVIVVGYVVLFV